MKRWFPVLALAAWLLWAALSGTLLLGGRSATVRPLVDLAVGTTVAVHLIGAGWLIGTRLAPAPRIGPGWALVQAEKYRRQGGVFAGWGSVLSASWLLIRPATASPSGLVEWPVWGLVAVNLSFQLGVLTATALVTAARVKLGRQLSESAADQEVRDLMPEFATERGQI